MQKFNLASEAKNFPVRHLRQGSYLYRIGDLCDGNIYVVTEGVLGEVDSEEAYKPECEHGVGAIVGDIEVLSGCATRLQSYRAKSPQVVLAVMDKRAVELTGSLHPEFFFILLKSAIDNLTQAERELVDKGQAG